MNLLLHEFLLCFVVVLVVDVHSWALGASGWVILRSRPYIYFAGLILQLRSLVAVLETTPCFDVNVRNNFQCSCIGKVSSDSFSRYEDKCFLQHKLC